MKKIKQVINNLFISPIPNVEGDVRSYLKAIDQGKFTNKLVYGLSDNVKGFLTYDPITVPGALYCGSMGSGKSIAMRFTVATHLATNSENTVFLLLDPAKGMTDYALLFDGKKKDFSKNVAHAVNDEAKIVPLIDMIYDEAMQRKFLFSIFSSKNIYDIDEKLVEIYNEVLKIDDFKDEEDLYNQLIETSSDNNNWPEIVNELKALKEEKKLFFKIFNQLIDLKSKKEKKHSGLTRIIVCMEEFHKIPNSDYVKFNMQSDRPGSIANKMQDLSRIARSYGITMMVATQKGTSSDVPMSLKPGLKTMMCFKMSSPGEAGALNLPHANEITNNQVGRCAYEDGFIQYPYLNDKALLELMNRYYKPLKSYFLAYDMKDYHTAFAGKGNSGMVKIKPFKDLIQFHNQFDLEDIIARLLDEFKIKTEPQENAAYVADQIGIKGNDRYAIKIIKDRSDGSDKMIKSLEKGAEKLNCNKILVIGIDFVPPALQRKEAQGEGDFIVLDKDDLIQIANIFDNREVLQAQGSYNELYLQYQLSSPADVGLESEEDAVVTGLVEEEKKAIREKRKIDYAELKSNNQSLDAYVTNDQIEIINLPENIKEDFNKKKKDFKEKGIMPKINDPLVDDLIEKKEKLIKKDKEKPESIHKEDKIKINKEEPKQELRQTVLEEKKPSLNVSKVKEVSSIEDELRNKLMMLKTKVKEKNKEEQLNKEVEKKETKVEEEKIKKVIAKKNSLKDVKKKNKEIEASKKKIKLKKGLTKESILSLREELKKDILNID